MFCTTLIFRQTSIYLFSWSLNNFCVNVKNIWKRRQIFIQTWRQLTANNSYFTLSLHHWSNIVIAAGYLCYSIARWLFSVMLAYGEFHEPISQSGLRSGTTFSKYSCERWAHVYRSQTHRQEGSEQRSSQRRSVRQRKRTACLRWLDVEWKHRLYKRRQLSTPRDTAAHCYTPMMKSTCESRPPTLKGLRRRRTAWTGCTSSDAEQQLPFPALPFKFKLRVPCFTSPFINCLGVDLCVNRILKKYAIVEGCPTWGHIKYLNLTVNSIFDVERRLLFWRQRLFSVKNGQCLWSNLITFLILYHNYT